jgi:DNA-directed RNA polymerase specialized sigma24 family protein
VQSNELESRLSRISTQWTMLFEAHRGGQDPAARERQEMLLRYHGAVYRYLLGMLRDASAADDLAQDFALRFLRGDFQRADPARGRFRDFVKAALRHLVIDYWRQREKERHAPLPPEGPPPAQAPPAVDDLDKVFLEKWREELMARTWQALRDVQEKTGHPYHTVLRFKAEHPEIRSAEAAERLGPVQGKPMTADGFRQSLHRAREKFAGLLVDEVARSLQTPTADEVEQELIELDLLDYCRAALEHRRGHSP